MKPRVTCYGGVGEIGGNKFLLEDRDTKVLLDFGEGFSDGAEFFDSVIAPRKVNGAGALFEFGLLPEVPGLYSEHALQNTRLRHRSPEVDAVVLSHYHSDHTGMIRFVDPEIPVYCGETTALIHGACAGSFGSPLNGHPLRTFRTGGRFKVGSIEFVPVHVDHSIPGAYGFLAYTSGGTLAYTGDFRFHGRAGSMTEDFLEAARGASPDLLLSEGTRVDAEAHPRGLSEGEVLGEAKRIVARSRNLVLSTFRGNDVDRVNTFYEAATSVGRQLVVSMKAAVVLEGLQADGKMKVPRVGKDVLVYVKRKKTGRLDDKDYLRWERRFLDGGVPAEAVRARQKELFLHLDAWNFTELIDIKPDSGGTYVHAATEAFNEEGEREEKIVKNWMAHLKFSYNQVHASGHAPMDGVRRMVDSVEANRVVPIHTEHPSLFSEFKGARGRVTLPVKGEPIEIAEK